MGNDRDRWRRTFDAEQQRMWQTLLAHTRNPDIAADAVAEAFAQGLRRGVAVRDPAAWAWRSAFRIANGMLADHRRTGTSGGDGQALRSLVDFGALPDDAVALLDALDRLPVGDRQLIVLALVGGLGSDEIGALTGARPGTVRVRLHRARGRLRAALADEPPLPVADGGLNTTARPPMGGNP